MTEKSQTEMATTKEKEEKFRFFFFEREIGSCTAIRQVSQ